MSSIVRFAVLGEGPNEHGQCNDGPNLASLCDGRLRGSLVTLVERALKQLLGRQCETLCWVLPDRRYLGQLGPPPSPTAVLTHGNLLLPFLYSLLHPVRLTPEGPKSADLVVLSVDSENAGSFTKAVDGLPSELRRRTVPLVIEPELEILFIQSKGPLEKAIGIPACSSQQPSRTGKPKDCLRDWLKSYGGGQEPKTKFLQKVAWQLNVGEDSELKAVPAWTKLVKGLAECCKEA